MANAHLAVRKAIYDRTGAKSGPKVKDTGYAPAVVFWLVCG